MADREPSALGSGRPTASARFRSVGFLAVLLAASLLAAATVLLRGETHGPALHWDSVNYLAAARNLLAGEGLRNFGGSPYALSACGESPGSARRREAPTGEGYSLAGRGSEAARRQGA